MCVQRLRWLDDAKQCSKIYKDCADGFVGAFGKDRSNAFADWVRDNQVEHVSCDTTLACSD